jgi:hypothetical protein
VAPILEAPPTHAQRDAAIALLCADYRGVLIATAGGAPASEDALAAAAERLRRGLRDERRWGVIQADDIAAERQKRLAIMVGTVLEKKAPAAGSADADGLYPLACLTSDVAWPAGVVRGMRVFADARAMRVRER